MSRWLAVLSGTALLVGLAFGMAAATGAVVATPSAPVPPQTGPATTPPTVKKDPGKKDTEAHVPPDVSTRLEQLEKNVKNYESAAQLKSIDEHLGKIESRLDRIGESASTMWSLLYAVIVVSVAAGLASIVAAFLQQKRLNEVVTDMSGLVRAITDRRPAPAVLAVEPQSAPTGGGIGTQIRGRNFGAGATTRFGSNVAFGSRVISAELIEATAPPGVAGPCDVSVQNPDGGLDTLKAAFKYSPPPAIRQVIPKTGPPGVVGTKIVILGSGFWPTAQAEIGGRPVPTTLGSENDLTCEVPQGRLNDTASVAVRNPDQQVGQWADQFKYQ